MFSAELFILSLCTYFEWSSAIVGVDLNLWRCLLQTSLVRSSCTSDRRLESALCLCMHCSLCQIECCTEHHWHHACPHITPPECRQVLGMRSEPVPSQAGHPILCWASHPVLGVTFRAGCPILCWLSHPKLAFPSRAGQPYQVAVLGPAQGSLGQGKQMHFFFSEDPFLILLSVVQTYLLVLTVELVVICHDLIGITNPLSNCCCLGKRKFDIHSKSRHNNKLYKKGNMEV